MKLYSKIVISVLFIIPMILTISPVSTAFTCNAINICDEPNNQIFHSLCSDGEGGAIITWADNRSGLGYDIYAQKIDVNGDIVWAPNGVAICIDDGDQKYSRICNDGEGGAIIAWKDYKNESSYDLYVQRINVNGTLLWNASGVLDFSSGYSSLQMCSDNSGGAIIAWESSNIFAQHISFNGTVMWDTKDVVICNATGEQDNLQILCDDDGSTIFAWVDYRNGTYPIDGKIFAQKIDINGLIQWELNGTQISNTTGSHEDPRICTDGNGGVIITWTIIDELLLYTQRINSTGSTMWESNGTGIAFTVFPGVICSDGDRGAIIAWHSIISDPHNDPELYVLRISSSGIILWYTNINFDKDSYTCSFGGICSDGAGGAFITWAVQDWDLPPNNNDIFAQRIDSNGNKDWSKAGKVICNAPGLQWPFDICSNGLGSAFISWEDRRNGIHSESDIYIFLLDKHKEETIWFGNFYLPLTILAVLALVIVSRRQLFKT